MTPLALVHADHPILRAIAPKVLLPMPGLKRIIRDMADFARELNGSGLAAPQVGISLRLFVLRRQGLPSVLINPEWKPCDGSPIEVQKEACFSLPNESGTGWLEREVPPLHPDHVPASRRAELAAHRRVERAGDPARVRPPRRPPDHRSASNARATRAAAQGR